MEKVYSRPEGLDIIDSKFCPGCMHNMFIKLCMQVIDELGIADRAVVIQPIGYANDSSPCIKINQGCALHGRAPAYATGLKRCNPDSIVFTYQGDRNLSSIKFVEMMYAANRGGNICVFCVNNYNYEMTGGQMSPTTLIRQRTTTCVEGRRAGLTRYPMRMAEMVTALRDVVYSECFVLDTPADIRKAKEALRRAFQNQMDDKGFSFVEMLNSYPTNWGLSPLESVKMLQEKVMKEFPLDIYKDSGEEATERLID